MIVRQTYELIKKRLGKKLEEITVSEVRIGLYMSAVRLSDDSVGTSATFSSDYPFCSRDNRDFGLLSPSKIKGTCVTDILDSEKVSGIVLSLKMATLNALSTGLISAGGYRIIENADPLEFVDLGHGKTITIVGAFQSYIRKISSAGNRLHVLEMNENALSSEQKKLYVPASEYSKILPVSDIVIITGQTLVNGTIDNLLSVVSDGTKVIVTGPSSGILPDILFENKVSIIGAVRITRPDILFDIVSEGGTGFHLFEYCAQKICIVN